MAEVYANTGTVSAYGTIGSSSGIDWNAVTSDECAYALGISGGVSSTSGIHSVGNETVWANSGTFPSGDTWYLSSDGGAYLDTRRDNEKERSKRMLYEVFIVDPETEEIWCFLVVASGQSAAERKALLRFATGDMDGEADDYDFITRSVGAVRKQKEVQEVKIVM